MPLMLSMMEGKRATSTYEEERVIEMYKKREQRKSKGEKKGKKKREFDECFSQLANHGVCSASLGRM